MSQDTPTTPAPTFTAEQLQTAADLIDFQDREKLHAMLAFAASLVRREELLVAALETIRSEAAFGLSFGAGNDVGNKDAALRSIYRITTAPAKPTEAPQ